MPVGEVTEALDGVWRTVVDLNQVSTGEILTIDNFAPSPDGRKLLIGWGIAGRECAVLRVIGVDSGRSEEHTSELQSLMRISYTVVCLNKKKYRLTIKYKTIDTNTNIMIINKNT